MLVQKGFKDKFKAGKESGTLNYAGGGLNKIPDEVYGFDTFTPAGGEWWTSVPLARLILNQNEIGWSNQRGR